MNREDISPIFQAAIATYRPRYEDVLACESVTLGGTGKRNGSKQRVIVLCVPSSSSNVTFAEGAAVYLTTEDGKQLRLRQTHRVARLKDVQHEGMFDASFDFGGVVVEVTFESHLQREMFVAALKKAQRDVQRGVSSTARGDVSTYLSESAEAAVNADAEARVQKLRQEKRRAFTAEEEQRVLKLIGKRNEIFDDVSVLDNMLSAQAKEAELKAVGEILRSRKAWEEAKQEVEGLDKVVLEIQERIRKYSTSLLSKKSVIQQIEYENNVRHRTFQNIQDLCSVLRTLHERLSLPPRTVALLRELEREQNELVRFFSDRSKARIVADAMEHMQGVLHDEKLETDFPIKAVDEQKKVFLKYRKMIVAKVTLYALAIIEIFKVHYLTTDWGRFSGRGRVVWRSHTAIMEKLEDVGPIIKALERIDMEGFAAVLRKYRVSMQQVYTLEMKRFFGELKVQVKKVGWLGPSLLGERDTVEASMKHMMETGLMGETPSSSQAGMFSPAAFMSPTPGLATSNSGPTYACGVDTAPQGASVFSGLGLSLRGGRSAQGGSDTGSNTGKEPRMLFVEVMELNMARQRLQRPGQLKDCKLKAASVASNLTTKVDPHGSGCIRPDVAFAMALESVMDVVLREEQVLEKCFNLYHEAPANEEEEDADDGVAERKRRRAQEERQHRHDELDMSLKELFGGDAILLVDPESALPPRPPTKNPKKATRSRDEDNDNDAADDNESDSSDEETKRLHKLEREKEKRNYIQFEITDFARFVVDHCDRVYTIPMLCMVRALLRPETPSSRSPFAKSILVSVEKVLCSGLGRFVSEQTESIARCGRKWMLRPHALLHCFAKLPALLRRLEAVHNSLASEVVDHTDYSQSVMSFVDQGFELLDVISHIRQLTQREEDLAEVTIADYLTEKAKQLVGIVGDTSDPKAIKRGFLHQYRHHAFFCATVNSFPSDSFVRELLGERMIASQVKRDRYEELYLTRLLFLEHFPIFSHFILTAEDLARTYSVEELKHHRALSVDAVNKVFEAMKEEAALGVPGSADRLKKHFTRDVRPNSPEEGFHQSLLKVTWDHFSAYLIVKYESLVGIVSTWPHLSGAVTVSFGPREVKELLKGVGAEAKGQQ